MPDYQVVGTLSVFWDAETLEIRQTDTADILLLHYAKIILFQRDMNGNWFSLTSYVFFSILMQYIKWYQMIETEWSKITFYKVQSLIWEHSSQT